MSSTEIIIVAVIAIVAIVAIGYLALQRRRSQELRERFGPEYERTVQAARDRIAAEKDLRSRQERVEALEIRPLDAAQRDVFAARWREVQAMFVDDPAHAVDQADSLIGEVMRARGYPVGDFEQRAADISVDHPQVVDHYRTAHAIAVKQRTGDGATEQLRQAFVHYRALFADLLEVAEAPEPAAGATEPLTTDTAATTQSTSLATASADAAAADAAIATQTTPSTPDVTREPADTARTSR